MKFSLKTKFYIYILPLTIILPFLLYSLAAPYSQMRIVFNHFKTDANSAISTQDLAVSIESQQLSLFHYVSADSVAGAAKYKQIFIDKQTKSRRDLDTLYQSYDSLSTNELDETRQQEKELLDEVNAAYALLNMQTNTVFQYMENNNKAAAYDFMRVKMDATIENTLDPAMDQMIALKVDGVKNSLPLLISIIQRFGVMPLPGVKQQINEISANLEHTIETQNISKLIDRQQREVFNEVTQIGTKAVTQKMQLSQRDEIENVEKQTEGIISLLKKELPLENEKNNLELQNVNNIDKTFAVFSQKVDQILTLAEKNKKEEALMDLSNDLDQYIDSNLDPEISSLIASNIQDVNTSINSLTTRLNIIIVGIYTLCLFVFLFGIFSLLILSRTIITPIIALRNATSRIASGDLTSRVYITSQDEIGQLAQAFNTMTEKIQNLYKQLEEKVQQRTSELTIKISELENTKKAMLNVFEDLEASSKLIENEKVKAEEQENLLSSLLDDLPVGVFVAKAPSGETIIVNRVGIELLGKGVDPKANKDNTAQIYSLFKEDGTPYPTDQLPLSITLREGKPVVNTNLVSHKPNGEKITLRGNSVPVRDKNGNLIMGIVVFEDVTKERDIDRMKTEFISLASHQLRTPLSAMKWFLEMLKDGEAGVLNLEQQEMIQNVDESNERMIDLVNSLLNVSRIESGRIIIEPVPTDMKELLDGINKEITQKLQERNQHLVISIHSDLPKVNLDPKLIGQVYLNLLTNAIKYTPKGGEISIFVSKKDDQLLSQVTDTGYGIPKKETNKVFAKFYRGENIVKKVTDGNGLGLYLVKAIIESSQGKIWFESEENKGTTFWFSLPLSGMLAKKGEVTLG